MPNQDESAPAHTAAPDPADADAHFIFAEMHLKIGDRLQIEPPVHLGSDRATVRLIGYVEHMTLLVTAPTSTRWYAPLMEGDPVVVRVFSHQSAFAFTSYVEQIIKRPFDYLHLTFPKRIARQVIRKSPRIKTNIPASAENDDRGSGTGAVTGSIVNLSATGAEFRASASVGKPGDTITLSFAVRLHDVETPLTVHAVIRSTRPNGEANPVSHGVEFKELKPNENVTLKALIYQELIERPNNLA